MSRSRGFVFVRVFLVSGRDELELEQGLLSWAVARLDGAFQMFLNVCVASKCLGSQTKECCPVVKKRETACIDLGHACSHDTMSPLGANARLGG